MKRTSILLLLLLLLLLLFPINELFAQFDRDCINFYYGFDDEQDYQKAKECFEKDESNISYIFLILMYLNGDGVEVDYDKALTIWESNLQKNRAALLYDDTNLKLLREIRRRLNNSDTSFKRLDILEVVSSSKNGIFSDLQIQLFEIKISNQKRKISEQLKSIENSLNENQKEKYNQLNSIFEHFISEEKQRTDIMKSAVSNYQQRRLDLTKNTMDNFKDRLIVFFSKKSIPTYFKEDSLKAEDKLKSTVQTHKKFIAFLYNISEKRNFQTQTFETNQIIWENYRDTWLFFVKSLDNSQLIDFYLSSLKTELTLERIEELEEMHSRFSF